MLDIHSDALATRLPAYHEFLARFKNDAKIIYGFVEGEDDPSFYQGLIENMVPDDWEIDLCKVGNRQKVLDLYNAFDWDRFPKKRILFFINRDLSLFLDENLPRKPNLYITDCYSIENTIVTQSTCRRLLLEICNLSTLPGSELQILLDLFKFQLKRFREYLTPIMCWIIHWRRTGRRPSLNDIKMKHLFRFLDGALEIVPNPKGSPTWIDYIHSQCSIDIDSNTDINIIESQFRSNNGLSKFICGKYELWFLVHFALSVYEGITHLSPTITELPHIHTTLNDSNAILLIAPRARIPESLRRFLKKTCIRYIMEITQLNLLNSPGTE